MNETATIQQWGGTPVEVVEIAAGDTRRTVLANATVTYIDLEGGFYGLVTDDGRNYLPGNLPAEYRQDGLSVQFSADVQDDAAGIQMWGGTPPVEIRSIEVIEGVLLVSGGNATVTYIDLEGGFYGLVADDGNYLPLNLNESWQVDGTNVTFVARVLENTMTVQQWGGPPRRDHRHRYGRERDLRRNDRDGHLHRSRGRVLRDRRRRRGALPPARPRRALPGRRYAAHLCR